MSLDVSLVINKCPHCGRYEDSVFDANITHNLTEMAEAAGLLKACWNPDEIGATKAQDIIFALRSGIAAMKADPKKYKKYDAKNGWGTYDDFLPWLERYLEACEKWPMAEIIARG